MKYFIFRQQAMRFSFLKHFVLFIAVYFGLSTYAQASETEDAASDPAGHVYEAVKECYLQVPLSGSGQSKIRVVVAIDSSGALAREPLATALGYSVNERRLFRKVLLAIDRCTPFQERGLAPMGEFVLTVSQDEIGVDALDDASLQSAKEILTLPRDYLAPSEQVPDIAPVATKKVEDGLQLSKNDRREIQHRLKLVNHDPGGADGVFGAKTRAAISDWQISQGLPPSGYLSNTHLGTLREQSEDAYQEFKKNTPKKKARRVRVCKRGVLGVLYDCRYEWR